MISYLVAITNWKTGEITATRRFTEAATATTWMDSQINNTPQGQPIKEGSIYTRVCGPFRGHRID